MEAKMLFCTLCETCRSPYDHQENMPSCCEDYFECKAKRRHAASLIISFAVRLLLYQQNLDNLFYGYPIPPPAHNHRILSRVMIRDE